MRSRCRIAVHDRDQPETRQRVAMTPRVAEFRRLHEAGCFVMPNPWDIGSARILVGLGFPALATTSAGLAWSLGRRDNEISLEVSLAHLRAIAACVERSEERRVGKECRSR